MYLCLYSMYRFHNLFTLFPRTTIPCSLRFFLINYSPSFTITRFVHLQLLHTAFLHFTHLHPFTFTFIYIYFIFISIYFIFISFTLIYIYLHLHSYLIQFLFPILPILLLFPHPSPPLLLLSFLFSHLDLAIFSNFLL